MGSYLVCELCPCKVRAGRDDVDVIKVGSAVPVDRICAIMEFPNCGKRFYAIDVQRVIASRYSDGDLQSERSTKSERSMGEDGLINRMVYAEIPPKAGIPLLILVKVWNPC